VKSKEYILEFPKLRSGLNAFQYSLNDAFLSGFDSKDNFQSTVVADLKLIKTETMYDLRFLLKGTVSLTCDICLDAFVYDINNDFHLLMKISETENYSDDEIIYITQGLIEYDLKQYLYECLILSIPLKKVCALSNNSKKCNTEVTKRLEDAKPVQTEDPRWDKLKEIFKNKKQ
jgi:uncharacterized metal-binding protein YceD (DUF177 family)